MDWYYTINEQKHGPITQDELERLFREDSITPETLVWCEALEEWTPLINLMQDMTKESNSESETTTRPTGPHEYNFQFSSRPDFGFVTVEIPQGKKLKVEASAMATMDSTLSMKSKLKGGFSRFLTGESIFINEFTAQHGPGEIGIAPGPPGDIEHHYLDNSTVYLQNSAFVASGPDIKVESKWQGMIKGFFSGEKLFLIKCSGKGDLWFNTFGGIIPIDVKGDYVVDTGHIVGFTEGLNYDIKPVGGLKSLFLSGEALVCKFTGEGRLWIQTRKVPAFSAWVFPFRPIESSNSSGSD
ncbi:MAG: TIGR00266 family protein [Verrucomicrobiota bacterium]